jgi:hypothetical protein
VKIARVGKGSALVTLRVTVGADRPSSMSGVGWRTWWLPWHVMHSGTLSRSNRAV